ncbi:MAG: NFACT RNA binding domain-containing protein [Clostridia bacterium]
MALDGVFLRHIKNELEQKLINGRVDKVYQPTKDELVLVIRTREATYKLLLCARPDTARVHLTKIALENPKQPPMLCMLLRKRLQSAKLMQITQEGLERVLCFTFQATNELGDKVNISVVIEVMGKHSNIIIVNEEGKVIDALKRVDAQMSAERMIFPGLLYRNAPKQDKVCILDINSEDVLEKIKAIPKAMYLNKALMTILQGISPIVAREIEYTTSRGKELVTTEMTDYDENRLVKALDNLRETVKNTNGSPNTVITNKPIDFSFMEINQYGTLANIAKQEDFSSLLDNYYAERDRVERMKVKSGDVLKILSNRAERLSRKINNQKIELENCDKKEEKRIKADLLNASLYACKTGDTSVKLINYFDPDMNEIEIKLDPALNPSQNAQKFYKEYRKAKTAEIILAQQIQLAFVELEYVDTVFYALTQAQTTEDLDEIRTEIAGQGYIRIQRKNQKEKISKPLEFTTSEGFKVLVGRNNKQNDKLTLKDANRNDIWFHTKDIPGSHTVLILNGQVATDKAIEEAATLAALHSKAKESSLIPVDYTKIRYVSKPQGSKPGMVIYVNQKTVFIKP